MSYPKIQPEISQPICENLQKLANLFPAAVKDGKLDIEALREELGDFAEIQPGDEKYELNWVGKQAAKKKTFEPLLGKTLALKDDGKNTNTTENIYIEGDNLEALKLLRQNYYGEVKMIYIDPPYNTGNDFVYADKFSVSQEDSEEEEGAVSVSGDRLMKNDKSSNRYHSKWLDMLYPRLKLAKDLLREDGVIFISIDDNEVDNLQKILNEVFGENNFINLVTIKTKPTAGASGGGEDKRLKKNVEYLLCYTKSRDSFSRFNDIYENTDLVDFIGDYKKQGKSWKYTRVLVSEGDVTHHTNTIDGSGEKIQIFKHANVIIKTVAELMNEDELSEEQAYFKYFDRIFRDTNAQSSIRQRVIDNTDNDDTFYSIKYIPQSGRNKGNLTTLYYKGLNKDLLAWLSDVAYLDSSKVVKRDKVGTLWDGFNWNNVSKEGDMVFPNGKKPIALIDRLLKMVVSPDKNDIILDFFSGSASSAHSVMQFNQRHNSSLIYILIQLPENTEPKSLHYKEGLINIAEIGKERIRRAGATIKAELIEKHHALLNENGELQLADQAPETNRYILNPDSLDIGFKSFRIEDTKINWLKKDLRGEDIVAEAGFTTADALDFVPGFTDTDIVYELMLRQSNIPLTLPITQPVDGASRTYLYGDSYLICLEVEISKELVEQLAALEPTPLKYFFRDSAFGKDIAFKDETFRRLNAEIAKNTDDQADAYTVEFI
jgi:adenine-specific DNA-methyltransferase